MFSSVPMLPTGIESKTCCKDTLGQDLPKAAMNMISNLGINEHRVKNISCAGTSY